MDSLKIIGQAKLNGTVSVSAAKNSSLPILIATLLSGEKIKLEKLPALRDMSTTYKLLKNLGATIRELGNEDFEIDCSTVNSTEATYDLVKTMRASILVLGPLLARFGHAKVSLPGGCAIGDRPVDIHLSNLEKLGAKIILEKGYVHATCEKLKGAELNLIFPSVGATENLMMAATFAEGVTTIKNAAQEPEIIDLANFLNKMGACIEGAGTSVIKITGVKKLKQATHRPIGDRIEAITYIICGLATNSSIEVIDFEPKYIGDVLNILKSMGANIEILENGVKTKPSNLKSFQAVTAPYPGFPTDAQAQLMALMAVIPGRSTIVENIFENRFMHVPELNRLGANIKVDGKIATIDGVAELSGAEVMCTDLRASAALVIGALVAKGETLISRVYHLDRGYEKIEEKLQALGASISRVS